MVVNTSSGSETASRDVLYFAGNTVTYNNIVYYYVSNIQGDVIAILNGDGNVVVAYTYDAWGNILSTAGTMADTLGTINPLRYRGYVYDTESGLYYLQSRYYDPEVGRFINADALVSTGQGLLGNNMFAYCGNNPVIYADPGGNLYFLTLDMETHGFLGSTLQHYTGEGTCCGGYGGSNEITRFADDISEDIENFDISNTSEEVALESNYFSAYKGTLVLWTDMERSGSVGIIFMSRKSLHRLNPEDELRREWEHTVQLKELGMPKFLVCIGIPSVFKWGSDSYYDKPWEVTADIYGGVQSRPHALSTISAGYAYLENSAKYGVWVWGTIE